jgi:molecular chaperone GrpE (heat shock protein)
MSVSVGVDSAPEPFGIVEMIEPTKLDQLTVAVDRLTEILRADQDVIGRMQDRIESLQGDQVRALLGPVVTELANLHAALSESSARDYERLGFDRVHKDFSLMTDRLEDALDVLGAESVDARVGAAFNSRAHQAVKLVATEDPALDKTIAGVERQGFRFDPEGKPALYARVQVFTYEEASEASNPPTESDVDTITPDAAVPRASDGDLDLPFPLDPQ